MEDTAQDDGDFFPEPLPPVAMVGLTLAFEGGLGVLAWLLSLFFGSPPLNDFHWSARDALVGAGAAAPLLAAFLICLRRPIGPLARFKQITVDVIAPMFGNCTALDLAIISAAAGLGEEMLFRGFLQAALGARYGWWLGLAVASLLFGALHLITPTYGLLATLAGAYLSGIWLWWDNLLVPIVAHALYDFLALIYLTKTAHRARES